MDSIPPGLWYDEAIYGLDAIKIYKEHVFPLFFSTYGHPREPLFIYLLALFYYFFGVSVFTIRLVSALVGVLTVIFLFFLINYLFDENSAFFSTFLLAVSKWHIHFSRIAFRAITTPFFVIIFFYFFFHSIHENQKKIKKMIFAICAGLTLALGMYTYLSFRLVPLLAFFMFGYLWWQNRKEINAKRYIALIALITFSVFYLFFFPLLYDYWKNPFHFFGRMEEVSIFKNGFKDGIKHICKNIIAVALMFGISGDPEIKHNNPYEPILPPLIFLIFLFGLAVFWKKRKCLQYFAILLWLIAFLMPTVFSLGAPNMLRSLGAVPACCTIIGVALSSLHKILNLHFGLRNPNVKFKKWLSIILIGIVLIYAAISNIYRYFFIWAKSTTTKKAFNLNEVLLAKQIRKWYFEGYSLYLPAVIADHPTVRFIIYPIKTYKYSNETLQKTVVTNYLKINEIFKKNIFIFYIENFYLLETIKKFCPYSEIKIKFVTPDGYIWAVALQLK